MGFKLDKWGEKVYGKQSELGYRVIEVDDENITISCSECGAIHNLKTESFIGNRIVKGAKIHGGSCSKYFNDLIRSKYGEKHVNRFKAYYRYARERCCNPNSKDYERYKGKWHFQDYVDYYKGCFDAFEYAVEKYGIDSALSIDRINGSMGYEKGNVRFVPMYINSQNKDIVIPVMCVNIETKEVFEANSIGELAKRYFDESKISAIHRSIKNNSIYLNTWKIFHTLKMR